jgi:hypothetical protein
LKWFGEKLICVNQCAAGAAESGHIDILEWLYTFSNNIDNEFCNKAISSNKINVLQWAHEHSYIQNLQIGDTILRNGNIEFFEWAKKNGYSLGPDPYEKIINLGNIEALQWLMNNGYEYNDSYLLHLIPRKCINILNWAFENNRNISDEFYNCVFESDGKKIASWLLEKKIMTNDKICEMAFKYNASIIIKWLIKYDLIINSINVNINEISCEIISLLLFHNPKNINIDYDSGKLQIHFNIINGKISRFPYGNKNNCKNQKIILYDNEGNIDVCDFNCEYKCWWIIQCNIDSLLFPKYINTQMEKCKKHNEYLKYLL